MRPHYLLALLAGLAIASPLDQERRQAVPAVDDISIEKLDHYGEHRRYVTKYVTRYKWTKYVTNTKWLSKSIVTKTLYVTITNPKPCPYTPTTITLTRTKEIPITVGSF
jgi:hypothetical protein